MAVQNSIAKRAAMPDKAVEFQANGALVRLSPSIVRNYLTNGDGRVTDQEVAMFINLCKYQGLNPLVKDAYLIKYPGNQPATIITSKDAIMKRAMRNPRYAGHQAGIIVQTQEGLEYRTGAFILEGETIIGGWAKAFVKGYDVPIETAVSFQEYAGRKRDGGLNSTWAGKPGVMIRKVALVTVLREAFPEELQGMYASEERGDIVLEEEPTMPIEVPEEPSPEPEIEVVEAEQVTTEDGIEGMF